MIERRASTVGWSSPFVWLMAPLVDGWRGLSLTRLVAVFCCIIVWHEVVMDRKALSWVDFCVLALAVATAFGKLSYDAFLQRLTMGITSTSSTTTTTTKSAENTG